MNAKEYNLAIMFYYIKQEIGNFYLLDEARQKSLPQILCRKFYTYREVQKAYRDLRFAVR